MMQLIDGGTVGDDVTLQEIGSMKCLIHIQWELVGSEVWGEDANLELRFLLLHSNIRCFDLCCLSIANFHLGSSSVCKLRL